LGGIGVMRNVGRRARDLSWFDGRTNLINGPSVELHEVTQAAGHLANAS
jgi:hypothetical protein